MKIIEYNIFRYGGRIQCGVLLNDGIQWMCTKDNVVDYVLDGIVFTNKKYVRNLHEVSLNGPNAMTAQIIPLKYNQFEEDVEMIQDINLDNHRLFFNRIMSNGRLIEIGLASKDAVYVGSICRVHEKSFVVNMLDTEANFDETKRISFNSVRFIKIYTDYLDSLDLFMQKVRKYRPQ